MLTFIWGTGMGIYDAMKLCRADVSTVCFGLAASMGAFLLASGSKGKRFCMPNARVMIHQPLGGAGGSVRIICLPYFGRVVVSCANRSARTEMYLKTGHLIKRSNGQFTFVSEFPRCS